MLTAPRQAAYSKPLTNIDSLYAQFHKSVYPADKYKALKDVCNYWRYNDYDSALVYCRLNAELANSLELNTDYLELVIVVGHIHQSAGQYADAIENYLYALDNYMEMQDTAKIALAYNHVGLSYYHDGNPEKALENFDEALMLAKAVGDPQPIANYANNIAVIYRRINNFDKALYYHNLSLELYSEVDDKAGIANVLNNMAIIFFNSGDSKQALNLFMKSADVRSETPDKQELGNTYFNIGFIFEFINELEKAISYYNKSLKVGKSLGSLPLQMSSYNRLSQASEKTHRYNDAHDLHLKFIQINDSINDISQKNKLNELKVAHEASQSELNLTLMKKQTEASKAELIKVRVVFYSTIIMLLLCIVLIVIILKSIRVKSKFNEELNVQKEHIIRQREELVSKKEALSLLHHNLKENKDEAYNQNFVLSNKTKELKDALEIATRKKEEIDSSLRYAAKLQNALRNSFYYNASKIKDIHIFPENKDSLSESAFWVNEVENCVYFAVFDSPANALRGAFWCVMVNTLLNKIFYEHKKLEPFEIGKQIFSIMNKTLQKDETQSCINEKACGVLILKYCYESKVLDFYNVTMPLVVSDNKGFLKAYTTTDKSSDYAEFSYSGSLNILNNERVWLFNQIAFETLIAAKTNGVNYGEQYLVNTNLRIKHVIENLVEDKEVDNELKESLLIIGVQFS